ncbi:MAG: hypothetical protein EBS38_07190, partial [Actinobacteria bacterium]|nr:hypothetical protein [Actinomycetota bacterium]
LAGDENSADVGDIFLYPSAGVIEGISVDVTVEIVSKSGIVSGWNWDDSTQNQFGSANPNQAIKDVINLEFTDGTVTFRFKFWETGSVSTSSNGVSGLPVELRNLQINTYDLDGGQFAAFSGFQSYEVNDVSPVFVEQDAGSNLVRFRGQHSQYNPPVSCCSGTSSFTLGRARVTYDQATSVDIRIFAPSGAIYALQFGAGVAWPSAVSTANNFNTAPTSSSTSKYVVPGSTTSLGIADFGQYSDVDNNPLKDIKFEASADLANLQLQSGSGLVSVSAGSTVSADLIRDGKLAYLMPAGSTGSTLSFRVGDGLAYSSVAYSLSFLVATQPQTITFPEQLYPQAPGTISSSVTVSSGLPVTLTSNTPSVCSIAPNGTDIVPTITNSKTVCSVTATQPGNSTYASATPVTRLFYFSNQRILFSKPADQTFVLNNRVSASAIATESGLAVTLTSLTPSVCSVSGGDIVTLAIGSCTIRAEQNGGTTGSPSVTYLAAFPVLQTFQIGSGSTYAVTYDANTGTGTTPNNVTGQTNHTIQTGSLTKTGFAFSGWNTTNTGSGTDYATGSNVTLTSNLSLFAKWVATITFDSQGGSAVNQQTYVFGQAAITLPTATKAGSTFKGWSLTPGGALLPATYSSGSATLYAVWESAAGAGNVPYNGPEIISVTPNIVDTDGGQTVVVVGRRLGTALDLTIGGVKVALINPTATGFSFVMPASSVGLKDLVYRYDGGATLTFVNAIRVIAKVIVAPDSSVSPTVSPEPQPQPRPWSAIGVASRFIPGMPTITPLVRSQIDSMLRKYARFATRIECTGFTMGPNVLARDAKLSLDRATNVCAVIKELRPRLEVLSVKGEQELRLGGVIRRVEVRFTR